jgi:hypothetical protein
VLKLLFENLASMSHKKATFVVFIIILYYLKGVILLAHGRWFSSGTSASSTTKTGRHDIAEILLKVALNTKKSTTKNQSNQNTIIVFDF